MSLYGDFMDSDLSRPSPENSQPPVEVPPEHLSAETRDSLIESFVLREGTDYGREEVSLATKVDQIRRQLERGDVKIVFDPTTESVTLMTARDFARLQRQHP